MKKLLLVIPVLLAALLAIPFASAAADVTFQSNVANFSVMAFNCLDESCSQVGPFAGSIIKGPSTTDGKIVVRFPDSLATPDGYALFFTAKGYRPYEYKATWHTYGKPGIATTTEKIEFTKMPNICRAQVGSLNIASEVEPNKPVVVDTFAALDAQTASAFSLIGNGIDYIPPELKQEYYSADTKVILQILSGGTVLHTQEKLFTATNNNAIFAGTRMPVSFKYVPASTGDFTAKVIAEVIDDACVSCEQMGTQTNFKVLDQPVSQSCYTILNQLQVNKDHPKIGEQILVSFNLISNFADGVDYLVPVQADVELVVKDSQNNTVFTTQKTYPANPDVVNPVTYTIAFTPATAGKLTITAKAQCNSALCPANKINAEASQVIYVQSNQELTRKVAVWVTDALSGERIPNATVTLVGIGTAQTSATGPALFQGVAQGNYTVKAEKTGYVTSQKPITVEGDVYITILLSPMPSEESEESEEGKEERDGAIGNTPPILNLPDQLVINAGSVGTLNLNRYVMDDQDLDSDLSWNHTSVQNIDVDLANGVATFTPDAGFTGSRAVTFTATDTGNLTASDTIRIIVQGANTAPTMVQLPNLVVAEDGQNIHAINLHSYTADAETPDDQLTFTIIANSEPNTGVTIEGNKWVNVVPAHNFNGAGTVTIQASDGSLSANSTFTVTVTPVNDAPVIISGTSIAPFNESTNKTVDLAKIFYDADGDTLSYSASQTANITFAFNGTLMTIVPDRYVHGTKTFTLTAKDPSKANASGTFIITILPVDDAPYIWPAIPNITTLEEVENSIDLTAFENDDEEGPGANGNTLLWSVSDVNTTLFTATLNQATDFLLITPVKDAFGSDEITLTLKDSTNKTASQNITVTILNVNDAPQFVNLTNQTANAGMPFTYQVNANDVDLDNLTFFDDAAEFDIDPATGIVNFTPNTFGPITCNLTVCDDSGAANNCTTQAWTVDVIDTVGPQFSNPVEPADPSIYSPGANYTFIIDVTDNTQVASVLLKFNGEDHNATKTAGNTYSATVSNLNAGTYNYNWTATDAANNSNTTQTYNFTVDKAASEINLLLNGTDGDITVLQGDEIPISAALATPASGNVSVKINGATVDSGASPLVFNRTFPDAGTFNVTAEFGGNSNYVASNETHVVTVLDSTAPAFSNEAVTPPSPNSYNPTQTYNFTIQVTDNIGVASVELEFDGTNHTATNQPNTSTYYVELVGLAVGNHTYLWHAADAAGNNASTSPANYTVTQGIPVLVLTINGFDGNTSMPVNGNATIIADLTNPAGGYVEIYLNGTQIQNGTSPLTNITEFTAEGFYNITAVFPGDGNFAATSVTHFLTVTPPLTKSNFNPANGSALNYSYFTLTFDTSAATTCAWSFDDIAQQQMNGTVSSANGINHSAQITGLDLGIADVHVACNNENADQNTDLQYTVENILDYSQLFGTNAITASRVLASNVTDSTIASSNVTNSTLVTVTANISTITRSTLTSCTVQNSTIIDTTASDCSYVDTYVDPSNTTGSNLVRSRVIDSNVTYSNVTDSTITNSSINNSVITNSTVENSTFEDVTLLANANVANGVLQSGQLTFNGTTYDATANGPKNLTDLVNYGPVASFTISPSSGNTATTFTLTSTSTDANIPGELNDTLTYLWNLGDGTNSTDAVVQKQYSSSGTKTITLTVTDAFGKTSTATRQLSVSSPSGGGRGGRGGGGGGGGAMRIELTSNGTTHTVRQGQPFIFTVNSKPLKYSLFLRTAKNNSAEFMVKGKSVVVKVDESMNFDLTDDLAPDATIKVLSAGGGAATLLSKLYTAAPEAEVPPLPAFNFTEVPPEEVEEQPQEEQKQPEQTTEEEELEAEGLEKGEETVKVAAEVQPGFWGKLGTSIKNFFAPKEGELSSESWSVRVAIVIAVVFIGLALFFAVRQYRSLRA